MQRIIVHMDLDTFFVSVERLLDPRLIGKPVLVGGKSGRGVVSACSYETRVFGVHSGMPMKEALERCPDAIIANSGMGLYGKYSQQVTDIIEDMMPVVQRASIDEFYLDMTGMDRFFDVWEYACELRQRIIRETGLPISFGMASTKTTAKIATGTAKPNGQIRVPAGEESTFLAPLPIKKIPGAGPKLCEKLAGMGITQIGTIQKMPKEFLEKLLGKYGMVLWRKAHGLEVTEVVPHRTRKSISSERTFFDNKQGLDEMKPIVTAIAESLAHQLRKNNMLTSCVTVKVRYSDFTTHSMQQAINYTSFDHKLSDTALALMKKLYIPGRKIRLAGVRYSNLLADTKQTELFEDVGEQMSLYSAIDQIKLKFGHDKLCRGASFGSSVGERINPFYPTRMGEKSSSPT